jgi:thiamine transporter ThiT
MMYQQLHNQNVYRGLVVAVIAYTLFVIAILYLIGNDSPKMPLITMTILSVVIGVGSTIVTGLIALFGEGKKYAECGSPMTVSQIHLANASKPSSN